MQNKRLVQMTALWPRFAAHQTQVQLEGVFPSCNGHCVARVIPRPKWFIWLYLVATAFARTFVSLHLIKILWLLMRRLMLSLCYFHYLALWGYSFSVSGGPKSYNSIKEQQQFLQPIKVSISVSRHIAVCSLYKLCFPCVSLLLEGRKGRGDV